MRKVSLKCFLLAAVLGMSLAASAQNATKWKFDYIGLEGGAYMPTSSLLRDRFGSTIVRFGLTPTMIRKTKDWVPSFEVGYMGARGHGDHFAVYPLTVGVQKTFGTDQQMAPFVRIGAGGSYFDYKVTDNSSVVHSGHKIGPVTALEAGIISGTRFRASVRYYLMSKQSGVDFSGILISATFGVFKL